MEGQGEESQLNMMTGAQPVAAAPAEPIAENVQVGGDSSSEGHDSSGLQEQAGAQGEIATYKAMIEDMKMEAEKHTSQIDELTKQLAELKVRLALVRRESQIVGSFCELLTLHLSRPCTRASFEPAKLLR